MSREPSPQPATAARDGAMASLFNSFLRAVGGSTGSDSVARDASASAPDLSSRRTPRSPEDWGRYMRSYSSHAVFIVYCTIRCCVLRFFIILHTMIYHAVYHATLCSIYSVCVVHTLMYSRLHIQP